MAFNLYGGLPIPAMFDEVRYSIGNGRSMYSNESQRHRGEHRHLLSPVEYSSVPRLRFRYPEYANSKHTVTKLEHWSPEEMLHTETFAFDIRPKWTKKPLRTTINKDGTYRFDYAPCTTSHHHMSSLIWPKTYVYHVIPELFKLNARAYRFVPGKPFHELIVNQVGEGGIYTEMESLPDLVEFLDEQALACHRGVEVEDLQEFWEREQAWASWWAGNWIATGEF